MREGFAVDELLFDGDRVGRGGARRLGARARAGRDRRRRAPLAGGQGGPRRARTDAVPARTIAYYTYWAGVPVAGGEMYARDGA